MDNDEIIRSQLLALLQGGNAHMTLKEAVKDFPKSQMNIIFPNGTYSAWGLLEHIRVCQWDILDFIKNPKYKKMQWPKDYWPPKGKKATKKEWQETIAKFNKDSKELAAIVNDTKTNLYSKIKWGTGQNIFREILLTADHSAYHIGEFAIMRQTMRTWGKDHE